MKHSLDIKITAGSLLRFALPSIVMMVVLSLYTVVDGLFVARLVNTTAFSAVNIVYPLSGVVLALGTMFGSGLVAIVAKKLGEGKKREADEIMTFVTLCALALSALLTAVCLVFLRPLLGLLGADESVRDYARAYAMPLVCFFPASILQLLFQSLFVADGRQKLGLCVIMLGGVANIGLDYLLIGPCGMGIAGAAAATGIGYCIPAAVGLAHFARRRGGNLTFVRPRAAWRELGAAMANGSSEMVSNLSTSITTLLFNLMMMRALGADGVAAIAVVLYLDFVLVSVNLGYSLGVAPLIGYHYGAAHGEEEKRIFRLSALFCAVVGAAVTVLTAVLNEELASIFAERGSAVWRLAARGLVVYAFGYLFKGFNIYCSAMFTAFSDGRNSALLACLRTLVFLAAGMFALTAAFGIDGIWYAVPLAEVLTLGVSLVLVIRYGGKYGYLARRPLSGTNVR